MCVGASMWVVSTAIGMLSRDTLARQRLRLLVAFCGVDLFSEVHACVCPSQIRACLLRCCVSVCIALLREHVCIYFPCSNRAHRSRGSCGLDTCVA